MRCPSCSASDSGVLETRAVATEVRRRRRCAKCGARFKTSEQLDGNPRKVLLPLGLTIHPPVITAGDRGTAVVEGPHGRAITGARFAEALSVLAAAWPRVVPHEELRRAVYGRQPVGEKVLYNLFRKENLETVGLCVAVVIGRGYTLALVK